MVRTPTNVAFRRSRAAAGSTVDRVTERLWRTRREAVFYLLPVALLVLLYALNAAFGPRPSTGAGWAELLLGVGLVLMLVQRRRWPLVLGLTVLVVTLGMLLCMELAPELLKFKQSDPWVPLAAPIVTYTIALYRNNTVGWAAIIALIALACRPWSTSFELVAGGLLLVGVPALLGLYIGTHRTLISSLTDRAERAEREQHLLAEQARTEERVRLAEEMHDVVTHRISLMVLHAGALAVTSPDEHTKHAAEDLRVAGCQALNELRDLVGVLRNGETEQGAPPALEPAGQQNPLPDLSTLVAESASVGIRVDLTEHGNPARTSPTVGRTAYRIVQESLTNIRKHAPGASATVLVRYGGDRVRLTIRNTAATRSVDADLSGTGSGSGLLGLRQRVELVGGALHAGPSADGGFEVDAILPAYVPVR
jgi:signal transduction histidine kinase